MNVLVIEDERNLADAICEILREAGFDTSSAYDGEEGFAEAFGGNFDCIVLDIMLPGMSGIELVESLRARHNDVPVLMLTALSSTADKVVGLDSGADDYMTKPFETSELVARVRALTRRRDDAQGSISSFGDLKLDLESRDLVSNGSSVHLSRKEYDVLRLLIEAQGKVVSKQDLLEKVWGMDADTTENSVEAYVSFLRKKLAYVKSGMRIVTLRMLGYRLEQQGR